MFEVEDGEEASLPLLCVITNGCRLVKAFLLIHLSSSFTLLFVSLLHLVPFHTRQQRFLSQMSYRLTNENADFFFPCMEVNTSVTLHCFIFFLFFIFLKKHDNNPQIPNYVTDSIKEKTFQCSQFDFPLKCQLSMRTCVFAFSPYVRGKKNILKYISHTFCSPFKIKSRTWPMMARL